MPGLTLLLVLRYSLHSQAGWDGALKRSGECGFGNKGDTCQHLACPDGYQPGGGGGGSERERERERERQRERTLTESKVRKAWIPSVELRHLANVLF
jgi:hypothetical protein